MAEVTTAKRIHPTHFGALLSGKGLRFVGPDENGNTTIRSVPVSEDEDAPQSVTQAELETALNAYEYDEAKVKADRDKAQKDADAEAKKRAAARKSGIDKLKGVGLTDDEIDALTGGPR